MMQIHSRFHNTIRTVFKNFGTILPIEDYSAVNKIGAGKKIGIDNDAIIYDLNGRILTEKPKSGYYIQGGKKYYVE